MFNEVTYSLGVDLGTTYTAAAVFDGGASRVVSLAHDRYAIPSVVVPPRGTSPALVGSPALTVGATEPDRVAREFKRRFGDAIPMIVDGDPWMPEALTGLLLRTVVDRVEAEMGGAASEVVLTYPATWREHRLDLLREMAVSSGLAEATFITEPVAAAINYHDRQASKHAPVPNGGLVAVYDLGGGTFDAAVLELQDLSYRIRGEPEGLGFLGGIDFDLAVLEIVTESAAESLAGLDPTDEQTKIALARLREECTLAKEVLSQEHSAIVPVVLPGSTDRVVVQRSEFEERIDDLVEQTVDALDRSLQSAGLAGGADVDSVLLVGGSSRVPLVASRLGERLGVPVRVDTHPKQAIALGAASATRPISQPAASSVPTTIDATAQLETMSEPTVLPLMTVAVGDFQHAVEDRYVLALNGPISGTAIPLSETPTTIGRMASSSTVGLNDRRVSRSHVQFVKTRDGVVATDLESTNGTWVDGVQIHGPTVLEPGAIVEVGSTLLLIEAPLFSPPAPEMIASSWTMPPMEGETGIAARFGRGKAGRAWLDTFQTSLPELAETVAKVRRARRVFRPNGPRALAWFEHAPERLFPRSEQDEHFGSVTLGHGPSRSLLDLAGPARLKGNERAALDAELAPYAVDPWAPISLRVMDASTVIATRPVDGKAILRSMMYEFVRFHPEVPVVVFGIDPDTSEWSFLKGGNCQKGVDGVADHEGLVVSFEPGRVASVGVSASGTERGSRGAIRIVELGAVRDDADAMVTPTAEDGVFQLVRGDESGLNFIPATLPSGRVPTARPNP